MFRVSNLKVYSTDILFSNSKAVIGGTVAEIICCYATQPDLWYSI